MRYPTNWISITQGFHIGKDIDFGWCSHHNQNIYACDNGIVKSLEKQSKGGNVIYIQHDNGMVSVYAHLKSFAVKLGQRVKIGEKIGVMGATGVVTGEHLHFGIRKSYSVRYKNSTINPFDYLEVYSNQEVNSNTLKKYPIKFHKNYEIGKYKLIIAKAIRTDHKLGNKYIVKVKNCFLDIRDDLTSTNPNDDAYFKVNTEVNITEIYQDETSRVWGKLRNCWIVLQNKDGSPQAQRID